MLAASFRRYVNDIAFEEFQHSLLDTLAGHVARDGRIVALAGDLVNLVDEHDSPLGLRHIEISLLEKPREDALDILPDIAGLGQYGRVHDGERNVQKFGYRLGQQCLSGSGRTYQQDIRFLQFHAIVRTVHKVVVDPFVVVIDRDGQHLLGTILPDDIFIKELLDFHRFLQGLKPSQRFAVLGSAAYGVLEVVVGKLDTIAADEAVQALKQERDITLRPAAEHTMFSCTGILFLRHYLDFFVRISSTIPYSRASWAVIQKSLSASANTLS